MTFAKAEIIGSDRHDHLRKVLSARAWLQPFGRALYISPGRHFSN
jgi:hypothetical protein